MINHFTLKRLQAYLQVAIMQRWCPWKLFLINYKFDFNVFLFLQLFSIAGSLQKWPAHSLFLRSNVESYRNKHFSSQVNDSSLYIFIRINVDWYRCKFGIAIFARGVTENTALYSHLNFKSAAFNLISCMFARVV